MLELPVENRLVFISSMYQRDEDQALAEMLTDVEKTSPGRRGLG